MNLSPKQVLTIASREYQATVKRRGFWFTVIGTPLFYAILMMLVIKPQMSERVGMIRNFKALGVVDSSGVFASAPRYEDSHVTTDIPLPGAAPKREKFRTEVRFYEDLTSAQQDLRAGTMTQVIVFPSDYLQTGRMKRFVLRDNIMSDEQDDVVRHWIVRGLFTQYGDTSRIARATRPLGSSDLYTLNDSGAFALKDKRGARAVLDFLLPFGFALLLGLTIVIGGQYLLQGVNEEKESRILESLLCTVTPDELLAGKLIGLGSAGLTLVLSWMVLGAFVAGPAAALVRASVHPSLLVLMVGYFLLGYVFYGSLMMGIGAIASNMREAQQFSVWFTFTLFVPFYLMMPIMGNPGSPLSLTLSLLPPTAPVTSVLRIMAPGSSVPPWQVALSMLSLALSALLVLWVSSRLFRVGMLLYGKTPTLPEILKIIQKG